MALLVSMSIPPHIYDFFGFDQNIIDTNILELIIHKAYKNLRLSFSKNQSRNEKSSLVKVTNTTMCIDIHVIAAIKFLHNCIMILDKFKNSASRA